MSTISIVLQDVQPFRCDWTRIEQPLGHRRYLLYSHHAAEMLGDDTLGAFDQAYRLDDFSFDALHAHPAMYGAGPGELRIATNDEYCLLLAAYIRMHFGLPGLMPEQVTPFVDKVAMKGRVGAAGLPVPRYVAFNPAAFQRDPPTYLHQVTAQVPLPLIAKPRDEANSRGVHRINTREALEQWCNEHTNRENYQFEEFIAGTICFCDTLIEAAGERRVLMVGEYLNPPLEFERGWPHGSITLPETDPLYRNIAAFNSRALDALPSVTSCITHLEIFVARDGTVTFLEVAARAPGAFVARLGELHDGVNLEELSFRLQLELPYAVRTRRLTYAAWVWFPKREGVVAQQRRLPIESSNSISWNASVGERTTAVPRAIAHSADDAYCTVTFWGRELRERPAGLRCTADVRACGVGLS